MAPHLLEMKAEIRATMLSASLLDETKAELDAKAPLRSTATHDAALRVLRQIEPLVGVQRAAAAAAIARPTLANLRLARQTAAAVNKALREALEAAGLASSVTEASQPATGIEMR